MRGLIWGGAYSKTYGKEAFTTCNRPLIPPEFSCRQWEELNNKSLKRNGGHAPRSAAPPGSILL